ncbi:sugar transferase [Patescibacteria group bacterium]|nr:MAG: sugar transferase [Patescibacteria group bacterium]
MKRFALFFLFIRLPLDFLAVVAAGLSAYFLRFTALADWRPAVQLVPFDRYAVIVFSLAPFWILFFAAAGLYRGRRLRAVDEFWRVLMASAAAIMAVVILIFLRREFFASRFIVLAAWALTFLFVIVERIFIRAAELILLSRGYGRRRAAIIGSGESAAALTEAIRREPGLALEVVTRFPHFDEAAERALRRERSGRGLDELIVVNTALSPEEANRILRFLDETQVSLRYSADLFAARRAGMEFVTIGGVPLLEIKPTPLEGWGSIYKRIFDIVVSFLLLIIFSPVILFSALAVWIETGRPVFFRQRRIGERAASFSFIKFRSMRVGAEKEWQRLRKTSERPGPVPKIKHDPRVTRVGRFLRRWSLDELPQLWNVLTGEISLVGPRPHLPEEVAQYSPDQKKLLIVKPGLTGLAQISGRADLPFADEARLDLSYIEHWSPLLDLAILLRTPLVVLGKKGAY